MATTKPSLGEMLLGIEGLALLRLAYSGDAAARRARVAEIAELVKDLASAADLSAPLPGPEYDLVEGYRLWAETYDQRLRLFPLEEPIMHRLLGALPRSTVLDAACGTGRYAAYLAERGHKVIGVDGSPDMLGRARQKLPDGDFREGDLNDLPAEDGSADAAICTLSLVHLETIDKAVAELARVVRRGGPVIISDVHPFLILIGWQAQFRTADGDTGFMRIYPHLTADYCGAFAAAGLRVVNCFEPRLTAEAAMTPTRDRLPEATLAAYVGLPGVIIWQLEKT
jgi:SAM-dependent methyltransferase